MIDFDQLRLTLWIIVGLLMATGVGGVALALVLDRRRPTPPRRSVVATPAVPVVRSKESAEQRQKRIAAYRLGLSVLVGLGVLTAVEFGVARFLEGSAALLFVLILAKAGVILQYYMHLNHVWSEEVHT
jgi:heme/copper-type cytochrome/quinol oxidase subunit 4